MARGLRQRAARAADSPRVRACVILARGLRHRAARSSSLPRVRLLARGTGHLAALRAYILTAARIESFSRGLRHRAARTSSSPRESSFSRAESTASRRGPRVVPSCRATRDSPARTQASCRAYILISARPSSSARNRPFSRLTRAFVLLSARNRPSSARSSSREHHPASPPDFSEHSSSPVACEQNQYVSSMPPAQQAFAADRVDHLCSSLRSSIKPLPAAAETQAVGRTTEQILLPGRLSCS